MYRYSHDLSSLAFSPRRNRSEWGATTVRGARISLSTRFGPQTRGTKRGRGIVSGCRGGGGGGGGGLCQWLGLTRLDRFLIREFFQKFWSGCRARGALYTGSNLGRDCFLVESWQERRLLKLDGYFVSDRWRRDRIVNGLSNGAKNSASVTPSVRARQFT